jgi:hypothetical protein
MINIVISVDWRSAAVSLGEAGHISDHPDCYCWYGSNVGIGFCTCNNWLYCPLLESRHHTFRRLPMCPCISPHVYPSTKCYYIYYRMEWLTCPYSGLPMELTTASFWESVVFRLQEVGDISNRPSPPGWQPQEQGLWGPPMAAAHGSAACSSQTVRLRLGGRGGIRSVPPLLGVPSIPCRALPLGQHLVQHGAQST